MKILYGKQFKMLLLLFCVITLKNCKKETQSSNCNDVNISYLIADTIAKKIPYIGNGNLVFVNSNKDTVKLEGCLNVSDFKIGNGTFTNGNCKVKAVYNFENKKVFYFSSDYRLYNFEYRTYLDETIQNPIYNSIMLNINNVFVAGSTYEYLFKKTTYDDSVLIDKKYYYGKYLNFQKTALFNETLGVIKFTDKDKMIWYLIKKESK